MLNKDELLMLLGIEKDAIDPKDMCCIALGITAKKIGEKFDKAGINTVFINTDTHDNSKALEGGLL